MCSYYLNSFSSKQNQKQYTVGGIFFLISVCYTCCVWRRIPFAAANLNTGLTAVKSNSGVILVAYLITMFSFFYSMLWMVALVGVYDKEGLCDTTTNFNGETTTTCQGNLAWGYFFLLLLAIFWSQQVFQNTIHVTIAGVGKSFYVFIMCRNVIILIYQNYIFFAPKLSSNAPCFAFFSFNLVVFTRRCQSLLFSCY